MQLDINRILSEVREHDSRLNLDRVNFIIIYRLEDLICGGLMKLAIFDFDGTLFPKDTLPFLLSQWRELNYSRFTAYKIYLLLLPLFLKYKFQMSTKLSREQMKLLALKKFNNHFFRDKTKDELIVFFAHCSKKIEGLLNNRVVQEVERARSEGFHTVLLSGTYHHLLDKVGAYLGFDTIIGTEMPFKDGKFDPNTDLEIVIGDLKLKKVQAAFLDQNINWVESRAYADGYSDIDLLLTVGQPVVVQPDTKLKTIAGQQKWRII